MKDLQTLKKMGFVEILEESLKEHWNSNALTDYGVATLQYKDVARKIEKLHLLFEATGIERGDKIALCGRNSAHWAVAYFAILSYGAVAVPILHEFLPEQVHSLVNHSEAKILFVGDQIWPKLNAEEMPDLKGIISSVDLSLLLSRDEKLTEARAHLNLLFGQKFPENFLPKHIKYAKNAPEDLALINYTSGTTSNSKGVMLPYRAIWSNYLFAEEVMGNHLKAGSRVLSILPMAHMYGMAFEFVFEFLHGTEVCFLNKVPSPAILLKAFADIKPQLIICVPLILEKIVRKNVMPKMDTSAMRLALKTPLVGDRVRQMICEKLMNAFGGHFYEIIIGGAALSKDVEAVLNDIHFPYTVGYGSTETAPIICYSDWHEVKIGSCGKAAPRMEVKINSAKPSSIDGEILVRGDNVMTGYFKNEEATAAALDKEGWFHTGDLGIMDEDGYVFIKGRSKNMLLGANGQNIYPEEIEDVLSSLPLVTECVVIQKGQQLYGLVYSDPKEVKKAGLTQTDLANLMDANRQQLNQLVPSYAKLQGIKLMHEEFEKTPKKSIRRFKYTDYPI